jgi:hypothetical protein
LRWIGIGVGVVAYSQLMLALDASLLALSLLLYLLAYPLYCLAGRVVRRRAQARPRSGSESLAILWVVCAVIAGFLALQFYAAIPARASLAKAHADVRTLASAVERYKSHVGRLPATLTDLTSEVTNTQGVRAGPFIKALPTPRAFTAYSYEPRADGTFSIVTTGTYAPGEYGALLRIIRLPEDYSGQRVERKPDGTMCSLWGC